MRIARLLAVASMCLGITLAVIDGGRRGRRADALVENVIWLSHPALCLCSWRFPLRVAEPSNREASPAGYAWPAMKPTISTVRFISA